jgi:hypothetical protein
MQLFLIRRLEMRNFYISIFVKFNSLPLLKSLFASRFDHCFYYLTSNNIILLKKSIGLAFFFQEGFYLRSNRNFKTAGLRDDNNKLICHLLFVIKLSLS